MNALFETLKDFVYPDFFEKGPPYQIQGVIAGGRMMKSLADDKAKQSVLEMITLGYRPATSLAILGVLSDSPTVAFHGMQIARELEKRFGVGEGWFTKTRYYSDRVGRTIQLLTDLQILLERKGTSTGGKRVFSLYQIKPELVAPIKTYLHALSNKQHVSLFSGIERSSKGIDAAAAWTLRECQQCNVSFNSTTARYCERCGGKLMIKCKSCRRKVEVFDFCVLCGSSLQA